MAFLFGRNKAKDSAVLVRQTKEAVLKLIAEEKSISPKIEEDLARNLSQMKTILQGTPELEPDPTSVQTLIHHIIQTDLLHPLLTSLPHLPFESRKDVQVLFSILLRFKPPTSPSSPADTPPLALSYLLTTPPPLFRQLLLGYENKASAMPCGSVLRDALRYEEVAAMVLYDEPGEEGVRLEEVDTGVAASGRGVFWRLFEWIDRCAFEVSADAFGTFREILTRHKPLVATFLEVNFQPFFTKYNNILISSSSYVTKRQSIKLLGELLLDRANYNIMTLYISSGENLKLTMRLLKDDRRMVNYEGFHVFKVFVANPNKSQEVKRILVNNRERLLGFLPGFLGDRTDDDQFTDEKSFLVRQIEGLPSAEEFRRNGGV